VSDGERLAAWLEELGLAGQLERAGLPTFERRDGRVRWTDPGTGEPLTDQQLDDLDRLLHHEGAEPRHAVPVALVQLAHQARQRAELLTGEWLTYESLAARRSASVEATRFAVHRGADEHRLLVVTAEARVVVPAFQLDDQGAPRADLAPVLAPLLAAGLDPWRVWGWLTGPAALLGGQVPEQAVRDEGEAALVVHAARRLAGRVG
jgi:hypothetical protein